MAAELVRRSVTLILAQAPPAALSAKAATATIPIVFVVGFDPVGVGLVASLNRPGGNATGVTLISPQLGQKRVEILHELAPKASIIGMLVNPLSPDTVPEIGSVQGAVQALGLQLTMFNASTLPEIDTAFDVIASQRPDGLIVATDPFFVNRRDQIVARTTILKIPTVYPFREYAMSGGLISYGTNLANAYRQAGIYAGRILNGDKPADLPVMQPTKFDLVINLKTAKALGLTVPPGMLAIADEVIE
jgi:putative ABC transport system substrate-binding protein